MQAFQTNNAVAYLNVGENIWEAGCDKLLLDVLEVAPNIRCFYSDNLGRSFSEQVRQLLRTEARRQRMESLGKREHKQATTGTGHHSQRNNGAAKGQARKASDGAKAKRPGASKRKTGRGASKGHGSDSGQVYQAWTLAKGTMKANKPTSIKEQPMASADIDFVQRPVGYVFSKEHWEMAYVREFPHQGKMLVIVENEGIGECVLFAALDFAQYFGKFASSSLQDLLNCLTRENSLLPSTVDGYKKEFFAKNRSGVDEYNAAGELRISACA